MSELTPMVERAQAGDIAAFESLVKRCQNMAYGYAYAQLGDFHLAEDAAQEAFVDAYRLLGDLRAPAAFPGWLRRIIHKRCDRLTRGRRAVSLPPETLDSLAGPTEDPAHWTERRETHRQVQQAMADLGQNQRTALTLFYLQNHSQRDIAAFLEVPLTTVKKRLYDARQQLKERMIAMVSETLEDHKPDDLFSRQVIDALLKRPRLLDLDGHPVRIVWDAIRAALPEYEVIEGEEIVDKDLFAAGQPDMDVSGTAYHMDRQQILRPHMAHTTFQALQGRTPPVRLLAAGRCFRPEAEDERHAKVFHQVDGLCIASGADTAMLKATCTALLEAVFGPVELRWRPCDFGFVNEGMEFDLKRADGWRTLGGCGLLKDAMLRQAGYADDSIGGFAFGLGLERLAMIKFGIEDIRQLWRVPYLPEGAC